MTRWMHPPALERDHRRDAFDPIVEGSRYQLSRELSLALWDRVCARATDGAGRRDTEQAAQQFHAIAARIAARGGRLRPDVGRLTRAGVELDGDSPQAWFDEELGPRPPGRETLVMAEARRRAQRHDEPSSTHHHADRGATEPRDDHATPGELPGARELREALVALQLPVPPGPAGERRLPVPTLDRMERAFGQRFDDVELHAESAEVPSGAVAFTRGRHIYLEPGAFEADTEQGEHVIAHELAHVAQQSLSTPARPARRAALEADAHQAALAALAGRSASVSLFAPASAALGFSNGESPQHPASASGASSQPAQHAHGSAPAAAPRTPSSASRSPGGTNGRAAPTARPAATSSKASAPAAAPAPRRGANGDGLLVPEAPRSLTPAAAGRLQSTQASNHGVAVATTTLPTAEQQTTVAREAVVEPQSEQDANAQHGVVTDVDDRPPPSPEIEEACAHIRQVIRDKRPPSEDKLVDAKPREMAQEAGKEMSAGVEQRAGTVREGYAGMQNSPQGTPSTTPVPATLPPERAETEPVNAGAGTPDPVASQDVSLDADVAAQNQNIDAAGMNTEPGKLVKDGPIGDAREGAEGLGDMAKTDPQKVLADQAAAITHAKGDMLALQASAEKALADARSGAVSDMGKHTTGVKGSEEQQRAQAGEKMKGVFTRTQQSVDQLLQPLSGNAVARWDAGVAQLSTDFEASLADVKKEIDDRHSGFGGFFVGVADGVVGLPESITIKYDIAEAKFADGATSLIKDISRDVNSVIEDCKKLIQLARKEIDDIVHSLPASLQTWAQGEAAKLGKQLDQLDQRVDQTQKSLNQDLISHANGAVQQVRERVAQLRQDAGGWLGKIAAAITEFVKNPFKAIVNGLLSILGIPPASFWSLVDKLGDVVGAIAKDPVKFGKTLISGAAQGFKQFFEHFPTHLKEILMGWLFGTLGTAGIPMPTDFSGPGIMPTVLGIVGIDTSTIMSMFGADVSDPAEMAEVHQELAGVLSGDPHALVALFRDHFDPASLVPMIKEAAMGFLIQALITQVAPRIAAMLVPGGAILQAVEAIFKVLMWVVSNAARIFTLIESLVATAGQAVAGNVSGVATGVEGGLVQIIVLVIDFLAGYIGLGGIGAKLKGVIMKVGGKLKGVLQKVLDAVKKRAKTKAKAKHEHDKPAHDKTKPADDKAAHPKPDERDPQKAKDDAKDPRNHKADPDDKDPRNHKADPDDKDPRSHKPEDEHDPKRPKEHEDDHDPKRPKHHEDEHDPNKRKEHDDDDPKKKKDDDEDDPKKKKEKDQAEAKRLAHSTSRQAWANARTATMRRLLNESQLESLLARESSVDRPGTHVTLKLTKLVKSWSIESHVRIDRAIAEATAGHGWIATEPSGRPWFAGTDLSEFNRRVIDDARRALREPPPSATTGHVDNSMEEKYRAKVSQGERVEAKGQEQLEDKIQGPRFSIKMEPFAQVEHDHKVTTFFKVTPNEAEASEVYDVKPPGHDGSRGDPFWIRWHKPSLAGYPALEIDNEDGSNRTVSPGKKTIVTVRYNSADSIKRIARITSQIRSTTSDLDRVKALAEETGDIDEFLLKARNAYADAQTAVDELKKAGAPSWKVRKSKENKQLIAARRALMSAQVYVGRIQIAKPALEIVLSRQTALIEDFDALNGTIERTEILGIDDENKPELDKLVGPRTSGTSRAFQNDFTTFLADAGYDARDQNQPIDHVIDLSLGGPDKFGNLWPLDRARNVSPNQRISPETGMDISLPKGAGEDRALHISTGDGIFVFNGKYFIIKDF